MNRWRLILLLLGIAFLYFLPLGRRDLWEPDEPRHALMCQEVIDGGWRPFVTIEGKPDSSYGPLYFWLGALVSLPWGEVNDETAQLPSLLAAIALLVGTYFFGKALGGARLGLLAAGVLAATPNFFLQSQSALIDMLFALPILGALFFFYRGYSQGLESGGLAVLFSLCLFLAWLTKGPVSVVLVSLTIVFYLALVRDGLAIRRWFLRCFFLGLAIGVIWWGSAYLFEGKEFFWDLFWKQTLGRFLTQPVHAAPPYYFLEHFPLQFLPWTLFLPLAWITAGRRSLREDASFAFPLAWFLAVFLFFSAASGKRRDYLLPLVPAAALLVARGVDRVLDLDAPRWGRIWARTVGAAAFISLALGGALFPFLGDRLEIEFGSQATLWAVCVAVASAGCVWLFLRSSLRNAFVCALVLLPMFSSIGIALSFPAIDKERSWKNFAAELDSHRRPEERVHFFRTFRYSFPWHRHDLPLGSRTEDVEEMKKGLASREASCLLLLREEDRDLVLPTLPPNKLLMERELRGRNYLVYRIL